MQQFRSNMKDISLKPNEKLLRGIKSLYRHFLIVRLPTPQVVININTLASHLSGNLQHFFGQYNSRLMASSQPDSLEMAGKAGKLANWQTLWHA